MPRFCKKPVEIEAIRYTGENQREIRTWCPAAVWLFDTEELVIQTLEGTMTVSPGDYVIRGVEGEFYPCKPDIFAKTYDEVES